MEKVVQTQSVRADALIDLGAASVETKGGDGKLPDGGSQGQQYVPADLIED